MGLHEDCPVEPERSVAALRMEGQALTRVIEQLRVDQLDAPTRLGDWTVQQLVAHLVRGVDRIRAYLSAPVPAAAEVDWLGYWSTAAEADPASISQRAREFAASVNDRRVIDVWNEALAAGLEEASATPADRLLHTPFGGMRLDHYLPTRVLEVTVHGLDLRAALGLEEVATPYAVEITTAILDGLLGGPRPADHEADPIAYILAATGRRSDPDPRLPVLT